MDARVLGPRGIPQCHYRPERHSRARRRSHGHTAGRFAAPRIRNAAYKSGPIHVLSGGQLGITASGFFAPAPVVLTGYGAGSSNSGGAMRLNVHSANITWPGDVAFADDTQITFYSAGGSYKFTAPMTGAGNVQFRAGGAAANHAHTVLLAAASAFTGNTTAIGDAANITLQLFGGPDRLPISTVLTLAGDYFSSTALRGWLDLNGNSGTLAGLTTANGARGTGDNRVLNSATAANATLTIDNAGDWTFAGMLGTGRTLSGVGVVAGPITLAGIHQPGVGGKRTFANGVTFTATAHEVWQLLGNTTTGATTNFDQVAVTGTATVAKGAALDVNLSAAGSQVNLANAFWTQTHTWVVLTAASVSGTFTLGTVGSDPAGNPAAYYGVSTVAQTASAVSLVWTPFAPYTVWRNVHFGANVGNPAVAGNAANPAGDGIANLIKYALGLDPTVSSVAGLPSAKVTTGHLQTQFSRNTAATDITYQVQASNDLLTWSNIATLAAGASTWTTTGSTVTDNGGQVTVVDAVITPPAARRFLRVSVNQP